MKITLKAVCLMFAFVLFAPLSILAQDRDLRSDEIPTTIQDYVKTHFPSLQIVKAELDVERNSKEYDIELSDDTELEFDGDFNIIKIERKTALPDSVVLQTILSYVKANYPNAIILSWEMKLNHQEVELNNDIELEFTKDGEFIRVDD